MTSHYELIENAIVSILKIKLPKTVAGNPVALVQAYPDDPRDLEAPTPAVRFLCGYTSSTFTDVNPEPLVQAEALTITGYLEVMASPGMRGHQGAYVVLKSVMDTLRDFYPVRGGQLSPLKPTSCRLRDQEDGSWLWEISLTCTTYSNQDYVGLDFSQIVDDNLPFGAGPPLPPNWTISAGLWRVAISNPPIIPPSESDDLTLDSTISYTHTE